MQFAGTHFALNNYYGAITYTQYIMMVLQKERVGSITFMQRECKTAEDVLNCPLRLSSGWKPEDSKKWRDELPSCLAHEISLPLSMIGRAPFGIPKPVFWTLFGGLENVFEVDIDAAHFQTMQYRCIKTGSQIALEPLNNYVEHTKHHREETAQQCKVSYDAAKTLEKIVQYQGSIKKWKTEYKTSKIPDFMVKLDKVMKLVIDEDAANHPVDLAKAVEAGAKRPKVTNHAWQNLKVERMMVEILKGTVESVEATWCMNTGDGGIVEGDRSLVQLQLDTLPFKASIKELPKNGSEFEALMIDRCAQKKVPCDLGPLLCPSSLLALKKAQEHIHESEKTRPDREIARALMPHVLPYFCEKWVTCASEKGKAKDRCCLEHWNTETLMWEADGGEEMLVPFVEKLLVKFFIDFKLKWVEEEVDGYLKWVLRPVAEHRSGLVNHDDFVNKVARILRNMMKTDPNNPCRNKPLNDISHCIHFSCGTTLDLGYFLDADGYKRARPFAQQLRAGKPEDRNSKSTGNKWMEIDAELASRISAVCASYVELCEEYGNFSIDEADSPLAQSLYEALTGLKDTKSLILKFLFPTHKSFDVTMYELCSVWTCGTSQCLLYEEFPYFYGKYGKNAKGTLHGHGRLL